MGLKIDRRATLTTRIIGYCLLAAILLCLLKIFIWEQSYYSNKSAETRNVQQSVITGLEDAVSPSEQKPTDEEYKNHQVYTTEPRYLEISRLELKARVFDSNVNESVMPLPDNIYDIAWYSGSGNPGQGGNILMSGISEGKTAHGAFANLDSLEKDDEIIITRGDGETYKYSVQEVMIIDKDEAKNKLPIAQKRLDDKETLALITARRADEDEKDFNSIVIVRATIK